MASFAQLRPGDPQRLGGLDLLGRLGEGGQGVVYLAKDSSGSNVAVKWLRPDLSGDQVSVERFLREVQVAQQVAPFCTAAVLGTGVEQDRPYIISEFIEGPSLQRVVQEEGPRAGSVLQRLAIGTATALAAIHQAGIVHRDFKPANVIIGTDGPRVIDFGIARALNATSTISSMVVGTPSYMSPEQVMGHKVGPAADMFAWAGAMVFAASGRAPFGSDSMPAVINRVLNQQPDLGVLDGTLREVVAACFSKDPAQRPTAEQVIMRLLQHPASNSGILAQAAAEAALHQQPPPFGPSSGPLSGPSPGLTPPSGPMPYAAPAPYAGPVPRQQWQPPHNLPTHPSAHGLPPARKAKAPLIVGSTVAVALLLLAGVVVIIQRDKSAVVAQPSDPPSLPAAPARTGTGAEPSTAVAVPPSGTKRKIPGGNSISLYENPADAIVLTAYEVYEKKNDDWIDYARGSLRGTFSRYSANWESQVSPDGRYLVSRGKDYTSDGFDFIVIADRETGDRRTIKTVKEPQVSVIKAWSRDGSKILLNVQRMSEGDWPYLGFVLVDVATKKATTVSVNDRAIRKTAFSFDDRDEGVVNVYGEETNRNLRFFDTEGKATRTLRGIGTLPPDAQDIFSPSGKTFVTNCPNEGDGDHCIWDTESGDRVRKFSSDCDRVLGFYDEDHLYCWEEENGVNNEVQVIDFTGRPLRKLLEAPDTVEITPLYTVNPQRGS